MENMEENQQGLEKSTSYRYWVREATSDAAPILLPKKISPEFDNAVSSLPSLGSAWNSGGTWEEKNLNNWSNGRIKELISSVESLEFSDGRAQVIEVSKCYGEAFLVTVRNKKRVGYTYELILGIKGEWNVQKEKKSLKGKISIPEFSFGELDELQMEVSLDDDKDVPKQDKTRIIENIKRFMQPVKEKLLQFEEELKNR